MGQEVLGLDKADLGPFWVLSVRIWDIFEGVGLDVDHFGGEWFGPGSGLFWEVLGPF